ncbi:MAG: hypothetical protein AB7Q17_17005 [Phycisphaerae bacterium]
MMNIFVALVLPFVAAIDRGPANMQMTPAVLESEAAAVETFAAPALTLTKKCPSLRYVGRDATFELTVTNSGTGPARDVVLTDVLPSGVEFVNADGGGTRDGNNIVWRIGALEAGASKTFNINVRCNQIVTVKNTARVTWCAEAVAECELQVKGIPAILLETVDDPDPIEVGGETTYTITVTNQGSATDTNIVITCELPDEETFVKGAGATAATAEGKKVKFAPLPSLAPKARATWTVTVKGTKAGDVRFRTELNSEQLGTPVFETESTRFYE